MIISPRYDGPVVMTMTGPADDQLAPVTRQRRRFGALLADLSSDQWLAPSRCAGWTVKDVVVHLNGVNPFWQLSIESALAGAPTRFLAGFDPVATPAQMVGGAGDLEASQVLDRFLETNDGLLAVLAGLDDEQWSVLAESPPGHVPIRLLAQHALWDCWVHERDVALPLGIEPAAEHDEVRSCLRYAAAVSPALAMGLGSTSGISGTFEVAATDPDVSFVVSVGESVVLEDDVELPGTPCLRGPAVELIEALTLRSPLPVDAPPEWRYLLTGLGAAFDADVATY